MGTNTIEQIRILGLIREVERLRQKDNVAYTLELEAEVVRLRRIAEAAEEFNKYPNTFTHEMLQDVLKKKGEP